MTLYRLSIDRPVLATVLSLVIVIFGIVGLTRLGVREYPSIDPPIITVSTTYVGAPPEVIESQITEPLEEEINSVPGIRTLTSISKEGRSTITVEFALGTDLEAAANDVRDRVSRGQGELPPDADPPIVTKSDADSQPVIMASVRSNQRDLLEISEIADRRLKPYFQTIPGVSDVDIWGDKRYAMRLWLDRNRLSAYNLTAVDVRNALARENVELPSGRIEGDSVELNVRSTSRFTTPEEFNRMVIREIGGAPVRLEDVGYAVIGPENSRTILKRDGIPMVGMAIRPQPGANQIAIADEFYRRLAQLKKDLPADVDVSIGFDTTRYIRRSIREVEETIFVALTLVVGIIFIFLRDWRSTIIPSLAIPVSLIGGFFIMYVAGFSINVLTLLALVLAIGLVVDDAIVVLENIYSKIEQGMPPKEAAYLGTREVFFAVISTTVALAVVFIPILFLGGVLGKLFTEFGVVLAGTVIISAFVALTLTPMLCARLLIRHNPGRLYQATEPFFQWLISVYRASLSRFLARRWLAIPAFAACAMLSWVFFAQLESELAPIEDRARLRINAIAPEGASFEYMSFYMDEFADLVARTAPEHTALISLTAPNFGGAGSVNSGSIRLILPDREERDRSQSEIASSILAASRHQAGARVSVIEEPSVSVGNAGRGLPLQFVIQAPHLEKLEAVLPEFLRKAQDTGLFSRVEVDLKFNKPELRVDIDRERAQSLGVSARDIGETLNLALSEQRFGYFLRDGKQYYVLGALVKDHRNENLDLQSLTVPSTSGRPIRLDNVVKLSEQISPPQLYRFNRYASATVSAGLNPGYTLGQGVEAMEQVAKEMLDDSYKTDLAGQARDLRDTASGIVFAFVFALVLIYLVLAAQFESFRDPLTIMLTVPLALVGACGSLWLAGQTINLFSQIGILMLIGLVTKNGILIVEFANQRKSEGLSALEAVREAAVSRFRPVMMTALATILGILPIALALGAGSESRKSMGIAVVGGMIIGTLLTLYIIPAFYSYLSAPANGKTRRAEMAPRPHPAAV